ncbi:restriction endonuclease subunit S [Mesorhizobium sp. M1365]|uniref:restriction endonuclease subunit S n=1 Tax=Mesorhizobium sp. M1365 TaxID=2957090 RepID=UPI00333E122D
MCQFINGRAYKKEELQRDGKYPVLRVGNFFTNDSWYYSDLELDGDKYCDNGDLLYAWSASFAPKIWNGGKVIYHYHIWKIVIDPQHIDKEYLYYFLEWDVDKIKSSEGNGSTMIHVTKGAIEQRALNLPPLSEQRRIAEVLRSVGEAFAIASEAFEQAQRTLLLFAEKLLVADAELDGEEKRLGDLIASLDAGVSVNSEGRPMNGGEFGILKTSCVSAGVFDPKEHKAVLDNERARVRVQPTANSIIISRMNTIDLVGANAFVAHNHPNLFLPDRLWLLKTNSAARCRWLGYYMKTAKFREQIVDIASGTSGSMKNISKGRLAELLLHVPDMQRQDDAIKILSSVEEIALSAWKVLQSHQKMRKSLSYDLLSGRVRALA